MSSISPTTPTTGEIRFARDLTLFDATIIGIGAIVLVMALLFPIQVIESAASVMFLLTFSLVNLSLIALRRKFPELKGGFRVPFYPITRIITIILTCFWLFINSNLIPGPGISPSPGWWPICLFISYLLKK